MAKQSGIIQLEGTIDNITFHKSRDGYIAKKKGGVSGNRIANDPAFQRTRENGQEFGRAGRAGKILRDSIVGILQNSSDGRMVSRLTKEMVKVLQADSTSQRGLRTITNGDLSFLDGFDFNIYAKLSSTLSAPFTPAVNRVAGTLIVNVPPFVPVNMLSAPSGATHFRIVSAGSEIDFDNEVSRSDVQQSAILPWDAAVTADLTLTNNVTPNSTNSLFVFLGVQFYQRVNGVDYPLKNGAFNALGIVRVDVI
jgi:hypothetical protein